MSNQFTTLIHKPNPELVLTHLLHKSELIN